MALVAKGNVRHVTCKEFPTNVVSAKKMFQQNQNFQEYNNKIGNKISPCNEGMSI